MGRLLGPKNAQAGLQELASLMHLGGDIEASKTLLTKHSHDITSLPFTIMCDRAAASLAASRLVSVDLCQVKNR